MDKCLLAIFLILSSFLFSQNSNVSLDQIRSTYDNLKKNDEKALPYVNQYIKKAKQEEDAEALVQGYRDAVFYSKTKYNKLIYSDSMIYAALRSQDNDLISLSYLGKGIIYYFNYKKFQPALDEYLKAYEYSKNTSDEYLRYKVIYHMAVVKSYLGYYSEALEQFKECIKFFEEQSHKPLHPNEIYNHKRGYYNSLHQMIICYRNQKDFRQADSLANVGFEKLAHQDEFALEKSYILKCKGISAYNHNNFEGAIPLLKQSLPQIIDADDFYWASVVYYYLGKSYLSSNRKLALNNFQKVDSIFNKHHFIVPEVRENYEWMLKYYRKEKDADKELYYTNQLLAVDSLIKKDFTFLSSRIHREYDTKSLMEKKETLEKEAFKSRILVFFLIVLSLFLLLLFIMRYRKERSITIKYKMLQEKLSVKKEKPEVNSYYENKKSSVLSDEQCKEIGMKLALFEENKEFTQAGLLLSQLAAKLGTNTSYLSTFINEYKGVKYKNYLNQLRIDYITELLNNDKKYLNYTIDALAVECGISSRQNFSDLFYEINKIRPKDFIRKKQKELNF